MFGQLPSWVRNLAGDAGIIAALIVACGVIAKSRVGRPLRWVWRTLVQVPLGAFVREQLEHVVRDVLMKPNGGKSLADLAGRFDALDQRAKEMGKRFDTVEAEVAGLNAWAQGHADGLLKTRTDDQEGT